MPSGLSVSATPNGFLLKRNNDALFLTKSEINRLHGIAFPEKKHGCCQTVNNNAAVGEVNNIENNSGSINF